MFFFRLLLCFDILKICMHSSVSLTTNCLMTKCVMCILYGVWHLPSEHYTYRALHRAREKNVITNSISRMMKVKLELDFTNDVNWN